VTLACRLLLFDLDGTLVDSAPDLFQAALTLQQRRGLPACPYPDFRAQVSRGGSAMLSIALATQDQDLIAAALPEFLAIYREHIARHSQLFPGMAEILAAVQTNGGRWGVVSNKPEALARALMQGLRLDADCAVLIGGDTLTVRKPDPAPLWEACRRLDAKVSDAVYVGDDPRDIEAARAAGMRSIAAAWGYVDADVDLRTWGADVIAPQPIDLLDLLEWLPSGLEPIRG